MKMWIARDSDNTLWFHKGKPKKSSDSKKKSYYWFSAEEYWEVDESFLPEVTFENSPMEVELNLIEKNK